MDTRLKTMTDHYWDVIVVGAGPAGAMAAYELARRSLRVLLVDKSRFPRAKVCGCCLNGRAISLLQSHGLSHVINNRGAVALHRLVLASRGSQAVIPLPAGIALSREALDMGLIDAAVEQGAVFLPETIASLGKVSSCSRKVFLRTNEEQFEASATVILAADGLAGTLSRSESSAIERDHSRVGAAVIIKHGPGFYQSGTIYMACGLGGYVGQARLEDGRLNIAAAFDLEALKEIGHPGRLAASIMKQAGFPSIPNLPDLEWKGTPSLNRRASKLAWERLFVLGDAAGFVEPFTGEGIAWALQAGVAVAALAEQGVNNWNPSLETEWTATFHREVVRRQMICRLTAAALRRHRLTALGVRLLALFPELSFPIVHRLNTRHGFRTGSVA
jgi:flavin-dependent dehydrogenase